MSRDVSGNDYRANFLWGFPDESIEALGYEFANGKTEEYLKEVWEELVRKISEQRAIEFNKWVEEKYQPFMASGKYMKQYAFTKDEPWPDLSSVETFTPEQLYELFEKEHINSL